MTKEDSAYFVGRTQSAYLSIAFAAVLAVAVGPRQTEVTPLVVVAVIAVVQTVIAFAPSLIVDGTELPASPVPGLVSAVIATGLTVKPSLLPKATADGQWTGEVMGSPQSLVAVIPAIVAALVVGAIVAARRPIPRGGLVAGLTWSVCVAMLTAFAVGWIAALGTSSGPVAAWIGAAAVIASVVVWSSPLPKIGGGIAAVIAAGAAGALVALVGDAEVSASVGAAIGSSVAMSAVLGQVLARGVGANRRNGPIFWAFPGACSIALAGPVVLVGGELARAALW